MSKTFSSNIYNIVKKDIKINPDGSKITTVQVAKKKKTFMTPNEVHKIVDSLLTNKAVDNVLVRGLNIDKWNTLKPWGKDMNYYNEREYYDAKVKKADVNKFMKYYQIQIVVMHK
jgi:hypothetical protein